MFGNKLGWGIAAVLAVVILAMSASLQKLNAISPPSRGVVVRTANVALNLPEHPELLEPIQLPFDPKAVFPGMSQPQDAGPFYRQAIDAYQANRPKYDELFDKGNNPRTTNLKELPAIDLLVQARTCERMSLYAGAPERIVTYNYSPAGINALYELGKSASKMSLILSKDAARKGDAQALAEACFSLGVKLCQERLRWSQFDAGQNLLREGAILMAKLDPSRGAAAEVDKAMMNLMKERLLPLWRVISSADQEVIGRTGGDVFYVAKNAKERMWRIEAILKMGWYKFNVGDPGHGPNQRWAQIIARRMAEDPGIDPAVRVAAEAARDLTADGYQRITSNIGR
jgi:hypothetical protein